MVAVRVGEPEGSREEQKEGRHRREKDQKEGRAPQKVGAPGGGQESVHFVPLPPV